MHHRELAVPRHSLLALALVAGVCALSGSRAISAQAVVVVHLPGFAVVNQLDAPAGVPTRLGDMLFSSDGSSVLMIGESERVTSGVWSVPVVRDASGTVLGFGAATPLFGYPYMDTSLGYLPGTDTMFFSVTGRPPELGERRRDGSIVTFPLVAGAGYAGYTGIGFVPNSLPNAGDMLAGGYDYGLGLIDSYAVADNFDGTFTPVYQALYAMLTPMDCWGDREFVPAGLFAADVMLADYCDGGVWILDVDATTGLPVGGATTPSLTLLASGLGGPWGLHFDPITGNLFVLDWDSYTGVAAITQISGFPPPQPPTPEELLVDLMLQVEVMNLQAGISNSLDAKLDAAIHAFDDTNENNDAAAINALYAFINATEAQRGKKLTDAQADQLVAAALGVILAIGG